jgi:plasmid stabilization system protein ParE
MQVKWSGDIIHRANEITGYYEEQGLLKAADNFRSALTKTINKIMKMPSTGMPARKIEGIRSYKIDKHRRLYYEYDEDANVLRLLDIFDSRQDPKKLKY